MAGESTEGNKESQYRNTALKHALNIEEKKKLKAHVADLVLEAYDLPSLPENDPAHPSAADAALFRKCLSLFQPSDLDDLIQERNIDDRCGFALCPKPNLKLSGGGEMVWNHKGGKDFKIVPRNQMERWCSKACGNRTAFVRAQLSSEPSWLRDTTVEVRLLDEVGPADDILKAAQNLEGIIVDKDVIEKLQALSLERGDEPMKDVSNQVAVVERSNSGAKAVPPSQGDQSVEGHRPRKVRFTPTE